MNRPEPLTTKARTWAEARALGQRLSAHELRCHECGELSEAPICALCTETMLESGELQDV